MRRALSVNSGGEKTAAMNMPNANAEGNRTVGTGVSTALTPQKRAHLAEKARLIRRDIIEATGAAASGHPGGSLSATDILSALYFEIMRHRPQQPGWRERDRFILSKGHAAPALYAVLAEAGYFDRALLPSLRKLGSALQGHPDMRKVPGVEASTGSLGQGLSIANGMALALRLDGLASRVYALLGDGECQEGEVWEAAMTSVHYKIDTLTAFIDNNRLQIDGPVEDVKSLTGIATRFAAFGWHAIEIDGHDLDAIVGAAEEARRTKGVPTAVVCHTIKGKGVSFMENQVGWHGAAPNPDQVRKALAELGASDL